jgi:hypothetical protein
MIDLILETCQTQIEDKIASIGSDMNRVNVIVEQHEAREREMAKYLEGLAGERPEEGRFTTGKFELYDAKSEKIREELTRIGPVIDGRLSAAETAAAANTVVERFELERMGAHLAELTRAHEAAKNSGSIQALTTIQARFAALEVLGDRSAEAAASPASVNPFACGRAVAAPAPFPPGIPGIPACFSNGARGQRHLPLCPFDESRRRNATG